MKRYWIILSLLIGVTSVAHGKISHEEALGKFIKAGFAYKDGRYQEATQLYEEILKEGKESGALYFNLANSYIKLGNKGRAILNYERARALIPRDSDLKANYQYALSLIEDNEESKPTSFLQKIFQQFIEFYTEDELTIAIFVLMAVIASGYLLVLYLSWPKERFTGLLSILALVCLLFMSSLVMKISWRNNLAVILTEGESTFEPLQGATTHFRLQEGAKVKILKREGEWLKIRRRDGKVGWIKKDNLEKI